MILNYINSVNIELHDNYGYIDIDQELLSEDIREIFDMLFIDKIDIEYHNSWNSVKTNHEDGKYHIYIYTSFYKEINGEKQIIHDNCPYNINHLENFNIIYNF